MNPKVDDYILENDDWAEQLKLLRSIFLSTEMNETIKWQIPVYTINNKNVASIAAFKNHCCIWFYKGSLLSDKHNVLISAQESTKALRHLRFEKDQDIAKDIVYDYILEAIENEKNGLKVDMTDSIKYELSKLLEATFKENSLLKEAFYKLTPGKQKEYSKYISEAKQDKTKESRLNKIIPMIMDGAGLHDKYKNC